MFERFTEDARSVVVESQAHARRLGHHRIGTEHLLLALLASDGPLAAVLAHHGLTVPAVEADIAALVGAPPEERDRDALAALGIDLDRVTEALEASFGPAALQAVDDGGRRRWRRRGPRRRTPVGPPRGHIPFSPRAKKSLELALREALRLKHRTITAEHLVLGVLREGEGVACQVLTRQGVDLAALRHDLEQTLRRTA